VTTTDKEDLAQNNETISETTDNTKAIETGIILSMHKSDMPKSETFFIS
jgi:hypothetical protein